MVYKGMAPNKWMASCSHPSASMHGCICFEVRSCKLDFNDSFRKGSFRLESHVLEVCILILLSYSCRPISYAHSLAERALIRERELIISEWRKLINMTAY